MLQKITEQQMDEKGVISAPNVLNGTAADNKRVFDKLIRQVVSVLFNQLVDALTATTGAKEIGADVPTVTTKTVQAILSAFDTAITDRYTKKEVESLTSQETTNLVENVDVNLTTGVMTITKKDGTVTQFDTALEKVPATFELQDIDGAPTLVVTNVDGSTSRLPVDTLVDTYIFKDSAEIDFEVTGSDNTKTITAVIRPASIDESKLSLSATTYLEGLKTAAGDSASAAAESEENAAKSAMTAKGWAQGGTNTHPDEEQNNSKYWAEQAADSAEAAGSAAIAAETSDNNAADNAKAAGSAAINAADSAQAAVKSRTLSESYAHGRTAMRPGEEEDNAKYYMERAKEIVGGDFATHTQAQEYANTAEQNANQHSDDALAMHTGNTKNPHKVTPSQIGAAEKKDLASHKQDTAKHLTDKAQTINGVKTFAESPLVPEPTKPENPIRKVDLNTHKQDTSHHLTDGAQTFTGIKTFQDLPMLLGVPIYKNNPVRSVDLSNHTNNKNNPHKVTPSQIGAYTRAQVDNLVSDAGNAKISIGSYTGTGTNSVSLTFPFVPRLVIVTGCDYALKPASNGYFPQTLFWIYGSTKLWVDGNRVTYVTWSGGRTIRWGGGHLDEMLNENGGTYRFIAIGI